MDRVIPGLNDNVSPFYDHVSLFRILIIVGFNAVLPGLDLNPAVPDCHGVFALQPVFYSRYVEGAGYDLKIVLAPHPIAVVSVDCKASRSVDGQVVLAEHGGVRLILICGSKYIFRTVRH